MLLVVGVSSRGGGDYDGDCGNDNGEGCVAEGDGGGGGIDASTMYVMVVLMLLEYRLAICIPEIDCKVKLCSKSYMRGVSALYFLL